MVDAKKKSPLTGARRAAVLLVSLAPELSAKILAQMEPELLERASLEMAKLRNVTREERDEVLEAYALEAQALQNVEQGGIGAARAVLEKALPPEDARRIVDGIRQSVQASPFRFLQRADVNNLLAFLQDEHPQTLALILAHLPSAQSAAVLRGLPPRTQVEVVHRMATLERTTPDILERVEKSLQKKFAALAHAEPTKLGGPDAVAAILNHTDRATEHSVLEGIGEVDPDLEERIQKLLFVFEDLKRVNDRGIQNLLKDIEMDQLALALKNASPELQEKFFLNMSRRAVEQLREEMAFMGPVRVGDVFAAQQQIVELVRKLEEAGELLILGRGGAEEIVP
ncbi:MAG: flagellar motor switch protein FliG [Planctomycetes bacterium]|nr:flagellar motor switch protein FliG [Planctomycetota bacterium]